MTEITPLIAGNWKMNGLRAALGEVEALIALLGAGQRHACTIAICPPATLLAAMSAAATPAGIATGGQDCHPETSGAFTGDLSAPMIADAGGAFVILGHSERRAGYGESDALVRRKAITAIASGLTPIICVGETEAQRRAGTAEEVVGDQLAGSVPDTDAAFVIAYEPVWAIGTGLTPTNDDIAAMHRFIRGRLGIRGAGAPILYGGSMKPANAKEILAIRNVNGGLIGGASLKAADFHAIISAL